MSSSGGVIIEVVPLLKLPRKLGVFDYRSGGDKGALMPGQLVYAPFRRRTVAAVVWAIKPSPPTPSFTYKTIARVVSNQPLLTPVQLQLAAWVSQVYCQSLATVLKIIAPDFSSPAKNFTGRLPPSPRQPNGASGVVPSPQLVVGEPLENWLDERVWSAHQQRRQVLIVAPEVEQVFRLRQKLQSKFGDAVLVWPERSRRQESLAAWSTLLSGEPKIVIGTRRAVFAPLPLLGLVVVLDEANGSLKQWDQNPRYHARDVAQELARLCRAEYIAASAAPTVTSYWRATHGFFSLAPIAARAAAPVEVVNLRQERAAGNYLWLSRSAAAALTAAVETPGRGLRAIIVVNKKGSASLVRCRDCGAPVRCPSCQLSFALVEPDETAAPDRRSLQPEADLRCYRCRQSAMMPPVCPVCRGARLRPVGLGVRKAAALLEQFAPRAAVARFDSDVSLLQLAQLRRDLAAGRIQILATTRAGLRLSGVVTAPLVVIVTVDSSLQQPDFRAAERTYQLLKAFQRLASERFVVQTFHPEHPVCQAITSGDAARFYQPEWAARQELHYPPFGRLLALRLRQSRGSAVPATVTRVTEELRRALARHLPAGGVYGPEYRRRPGRAPVWQVWVKFPLDPRDAARPLPALYPWLDPILNELEDGWVIDVDPEEL